MLCSWHHHCQGEDQRQNLFQNLSVKLLDFFAAAYDRCNFSIRDGEEPPEIESACSTTLHHSSFDLLQAWLFGCQFYFSRIRHATLSFHIYNKTLQLIIKIVSIWDFLVQLQLCGNEILGQKCQKIQRTYLEVTQAFVEPSPFQAQFKGTPKSLSNTFA